MEAAAAARGITPEEFWAALGGEPKGWKDAAVLYRRLGARTLTDAVTAVLGQPLASTRLARRGDVVMAQRCLGICRGDTVITLGDAVQMRDAEKAWSIKGRSECSA